MSSPFFIFISVFFASLSGYCVVNAQIDSIRPTIKTIRSASYSLSHNVDVIELDREAALKKYFNKIDTFNINGILLQTSHRASTGEFYPEMKIVLNTDNEMINKYIYNSNRDLKLQSDIEIGDGVRLLKNYYYDIKEKKKKKKVRKSLWFTTKQILDDHGNVVTFYSKHENQDAIQKSILKYDQKNQLIEMNTFLDDKLYSTTSYKYDNRGNEIYRFEETTSGSFDPFTEYTFVYDVSNNLIEDTFNDFEHEIQKKYYTYELDEHNNWITKKTYRGVQLDSITEREIEYY